jgi:hypothetical protein
MKSIYYLAPLVFASVAGGAANAATLTGDQILARAGAADGLSSYSAPVKFDVRMHRPISLRSSAEGIVSYKAPAQASLTITKLPSVLGKLFKTSYDIDLAPQVWPQKYHVQSVSASGQQSTAIYLLRATPNNDPSVDHVIFGVQQGGFLSVSAAWYYKDGSTIHLAIVNGRTSTYTLPQTETVAVSMPQYSLDATVTYGAYSLVAAIPGVLTHSHMSFLAARL